ncbi:hypothetical protein FIBSPDRAFT_852488 [Athelia psychrophila]|uniref:Uncharacterized protein n=1 Tax=Athelia psychrophila TaxID=1759441 RepID=A0A166RXJ3_9AGAM|nr:hypothetical protein FIBSPDRAFT_852488 [Fibularhizoctonia sp. CBS 109695]
MIILSPETRTRTWTAIKYGILVVTYFPAGKLKAVRHMRRRDAEAQMQVDMRCHIGKATSPMVNSMLLPLHPSP